MTLYCKTEVPIRKFLFTKLSGELAFLLYKYINKYSLDKKQVT